MNNINNQYQQGCKPATILILMTFSALVFFASNGLDQTNYKDKSNNNHDGRQLQQIFDPKSLAPRISQPLISPAPAEDAKTAASAATPTPKIEENSALHGISALRAIVTGVEHSGTTIAGLLLFNAPCVIGAYETGFLLAGTPADIKNVQPWIEWHRREDATLLYNLSDHDIALMKESKDFGEMIDILRSSSHLFNKPKDAPYCQKPYQMIDKTPRYIYPQYFEKILQKTPGVPVIVMKKPYEKLRSSWARRNSRGLTRKAYAKVYANVEEMRIKYPNRIMIIEYDELMNNPSLVMEGIFSQLKLPWDPGYLNMTNLKEKFSEYGPRYMNYFDNMAMFGGAHSADLN